MLIWGAIAAAGITAAGQWYTNRQQENFARGQSTTAYQRAVADMKKAGLNPMLAYQQGGASSSSIQPKNPLGGATDAIALNNMSRQTTADVEVKGQQAANLGKTKEILNWQESSAYFKQLVDQRSWEIFEATMPERMKMQAALLREKTTQADANSARARSVMSTAEISEFERDAIRLFREFGGKYAPMIGPLGKLIPRGRFRGVSRGKAVGRQKWKQNKRVRENRRRTDIDYKGDF